MKRFRWLTAGAALLTGVAVQAQEPQLPDYNLFRENFAKQGTPVPSKSVEAATAVGAQTLIFRSDRRIQGELVEITKDEIVWRRPDASEALHFPREAVRRIVVGPNAIGSQTGGNHILLPPVPMTKRAIDALIPESGRVLATVKLPGGDWLFGDVSSVDGRVLALQLNDQGGVAIPRERIEWVHFGDTPAAALGISGSGLDSEGWLPAPLGLEVSADSITINGSDWMAREIPDTKRLEVTLELPEDSEEGAGLWFEPLNPTCELNSRGVGTAAIRFGRTQITCTHWVEKFEEESSPLPKDAGTGGGPVIYRVFYDGVSHRIVVRRNGQEVSNWKFAIRGEQENPGAPTDAQIRAICLDRRIPGAAPGSMATLKLKRLRVRPWNGVLPTNDAAEPAEDRLSIGDAAPIGGRLEAVGKTELMLSGRSYPHQPGTYLEFPNAPVPLADADAKLVFRQGELCVKDLKLRDGSVRCTTAFAAEVALPESALQTITFSGKPTPLAEAPEILVFKNGDELEGKALSANSQGTVGWKLAGGQELAFQSGFIAGIHFARDTTAKAAAPAATVELRNGEQWRGTLLSLDEKQLRLQHEQLGEIALDRQSLWRLYPSPKAEVLDGGHHPGAWMNRFPPDPAIPMPDGQIAWSNDWVYLDGVYILRHIPFTEVGGAEAVFTSNQWPHLQRKIDPALERFEVRFEAKSPNPRLNRFLLVLYGGKTNTTLQMVISPEDLALGTYNPRAHSQGNFNHIPLAAQLGGKESPLDVQLRVDSKAATGELRINGVQIFRFAPSEDDRLLEDKNPAQATYNVRIQPIPSQGAASILSHVWVGPWSGELPPGAGEATPITVLQNGDITLSAPTDMHDGKFTLGDDLGTISAEKVTEVNFGGTERAEPATARVRLTDGSCVHVDEFTWDRRELAARGATVGNIHVNAGFVTELIFASPQQDVNPAVPK